MINFLFITADDMNWDAVGAFGCPNPGTTPNLDRLAAEGLRFEHGHVTIAVCQPSRSALMTGRYPHRSGGEGFFHLRHEGVPILPELLQAGGYAVGILGKRNHSTPYEAFQWDYEYDMPQLGMGRNPEAYGSHTRTFIEQAQAAGKPFFMMANSHDPHRPFWGNDKAEWYELDPPAVEPSRIFTADEVTVPGHLADLPEVRLEIAEYYSSVRRCDDTVGEILAALEATGTVENTLVMFLSDNGMAFPFAKTNCYLHSTRTPWIVRWPGTIETGTVDSGHFVSGIDFLPTILEAAGLDTPEGVDGDSFLHVLQGEDDFERNRVYTQFHQTAGRRNYPMRCVQDHRFGYIWNPWSNGERVFRNESQSGRTFAAMENAAGHDPEIAARVELFLHRVPEELYDFEHDPNALVNLAEDESYTEILQRLRDELETWMIEHEDPALEAFHQLRSRTAREALMEQQAAELGGS